MALSAYAPLVLWIALILFFSGSRGSVAETSGFFRPLLEFFFPSLSPEEILFYYVYVRKFLHFTVYAVLGFLAFRACVSSPHVSKGSRHDDAPSLTASTPRGDAPAGAPVVGLQTRTMLIALVISLAVALTDEYIQSLDPSRTSSLYDVAIDMAGAASMTFVMCILESRQKPQAAVKTSQ